MNHYTAPISRVIPTKLLSAFTQATGLPIVPDCDGDCAEETLGYGCRNVQENHTDTVDICYTYPGGSCPDAPPCTILINGIAVQCGTYGSGATDGVPFACTDQDAGCPDTTLWSYHCKIPGLGQNEICQDVVDSLNVVIQCEGAQSSCENNTPQG